jgi:sialate O-acetylesterase
MMSRHRPVSLVCLGLLGGLGLSVATPVLADVRLPHIFGNKMVLQADKPLPVWGWADPHEEVTVTFDDQAVGSKADAKGHWKVTLAAVKAGGPHRMKVSGRNTIELADVMVGEVWVCSGQSNMEMGLKAVEGGPQAIAAANNPNIRVLLIPNRASGLPEDDADAAWDTASPKSLLKGEYEGFSATAYFFACEINKALNVPVGVIDTSWGGTRIEPWTPSVGFASVAPLAETVRVIDRANEAFAKAVSGRRQASPRWPQSGAGLPSPGRRRRPVIAFPRRRSGPPIRSTPADIR